VASNTSVFRRSSAEAAHRSPRYQCHRSVARRHHLPRCPPITPTDYNAGKDTDHDTCEPTIILAVPEDLKTHLYELATSFSFMGRELAISELQNSIFKFIDKVLALNK
jgi:hypothetical protein